MSWTQIATTQTEGPTGGLTMTTKAFRKPVANGYLIRVDKLLTVVYQESTYFGPPVSAMCFYPVNTVPAYILWGSATEETQATGTIQTLKTRFYQGSLFDALDNPLAGSVYRHEFYSQPEGMPPVMPSLSLVYVP